MKHCLLALFLLLPCSGPLLADVSDPFLVETFPQSPSFPPPPYTLSGFTEFGGALYFIGRDSDGRGLALYRKPSLDAPSQRLDELSTGAAFVLPAEGLVLNDRLLLEQPRDGSPGALYSSDGTSGGTVVLTTDIGRFFLGLYRFGDLAVVEENSKLTVTDGTPAGTRLLAFTSHFDHKLAILGDRLVYVAEDRARLIVTDGTPGDDTVLDLEQLALYEIRFLKTVGDTIFFTAQGSSFSGRRLFASDGTLEGTRAVGPEGVEGSNPTPQTSFGDLLVFTAGSSQTETRYWVTDGTPGSARQLGTFPFPAPGSTYPNLPNTARLGDELWLRLADGRLLRTDGTPEGTEPVPFVDPSDGSLSALYEIPGHLLFTRRGANGPFDHELWVTDGTAEGTRQLQAFDRPMGFDFTPFEGHVYFSLDATRSDLDTQLWALALDTVPPPPPTEPPAAPRNVRVEGREGVVRVSWDDPSGNASEFIVQVRDWRNPRDEFRTVRSVPGDTTSVLLDPGTTEPFLLRVQARNGVGASAWSESVPASVLPSGLACSDASAQPSALCLHDGRFHIQTFWRTATGDGVAGAVPFDFSDDSGTFWFFDPANVELVVKVLDARVINGRFWTFFGALSDVEYWVVVTDEEDGANVTYYNPPGEICGQADTGAFPRPQSLRTFPVTTRDDTLPSTCVPDGDTLCLTPDRYRVTVTWRDQRSGDSGVGHAIPGTSDSGYFWFFDEENVELVVKVLDARVVNGHVWVFYGALTDVEYTVTVTDTATGISRDYVNPPGNICGEADVTAFD